MSTETLRRFAELYERKSVLDAALRTVKDEIEGLRDQVMEYFADAGMSKATVDGRTIYIHRQLWAGRAEDSSAQAVADALKAAGMGDLTTANWQSLSAWCREQERDKDDMPILPDGLAAVIAVTERIEPRARKAS